MLKKILYTLWIGIFVFLGIYTAKTSDTETFLNAIENKTFDLRQNMIINSGYKKANEDIVIVAIDDASYEFIMDKYGEWPMPRDVYAKLTEYIEAQNPKCIAFDLMFVKSLKSTSGADFYYPYAGVLFLYSLYFFIPSISDTTPSPRAIHSPCSPRIKALT